MNRYLDIFFRSKLRLIVLLLLMPLVISAVDLYLWRSYDSTEVVWVPDATGQGTGGYLGWSPYQTPAQNAARLFSNLLGTQSFNNGIADKLVAQGVVHTDRERASLITSLAFLTVTPGGAVTSGSSSSSTGSSGGGSASDHTMTIRYVCPKESVCLAVLPVALDVFKSQYQDLKAGAAATERAVYEANLKAAQAHYAAAIAAVQSYQAKQPKTTSHQVQTSDPVLTALQDDISQAQKEVDDARGQVHGLDTLTQLANGVIGSMIVVDAPKTQKGLYGIKGLRSDNLRTDLIALAACVAAAAAYLILVAFLDRTVRDPGELNGRFRKPVITIPAYSSKSSRVSLKNTG